MGPSFPLFYQLATFHEHIDCIALFGKFFRMEPWRNSICVRETEAEKLEFMSTAMELPPWFKKYVSDFIDNEPVLSMWICMQKLSFLPIGTLIPFTGNYKRAKEQSLIFHTFNQDNMPIDFMELLLEGL